MSNKKHFTNLYAQIVNALSKHDGALSIDFLVQSTGRAIPEIKPNLKILKRKTLLLLPITVESH